mmetsp:Transcript_16644/g.53111  ORF Transcript_16644/g.53111 Transcript_16644/m.53111 type:complete len:214 (-) Transcript_16644:86-727(-)
MKSRSWWRQPKKSWLRPIPGVSTYSSSSVRSTSSNSPRHVPQHTSDCASSTRFRSNRRCSRKPRNGATPVPGPIMMRGSARLPGSVNSRVGRRNTSSSTSTPRALAMVHAPSLASVCPAAPAPAPAPSGSLPHCGPLREPMLRSGLPSGPRSRSSAACASKRRWCASSGRSSCSIHVVHTPTRRTDQPSGGGGVSGGGTSPPPVGEARGERGV